MKRLNLIVMLILTIAVSASAQAKTEKSAPSKSAKVSYLFRFYPALIFDKFVN